MKYDNGYRERHYENAWRDTIAMERLTASPFVLNAYGNCGASQLTAHAGGGNLHDLIAIARSSDGDPMPSLDKLKISYQVAQGVADLHSIDGDDNNDDEPSLVHNDLCCHQFVFVDGIYKLNDFHLTTIVKRNRNDGSVCRDRPHTPDLERVSCFAMLPGLTKLQYI